MKNPFLQRRTLALLISAGLRNRPVLHAGTRPFRSLSHVRAAAKVYLEGQDSSEMFDVYEPPLAEERGGLLTRVVRAGYSKARGKVHEDGDWHRAVHVWIVDPVARTLLLQLRSEHKDTFPNCWDVSVGGHIEAGDESLPTAIREIEEELGLTGVEGKLEHLGTVASSLRGSTRKHGSFHCQELQDIYLLPLPNLDTGAIKFAEGEISGLRAVPIERLKQEYEAEDPSYVPRPAHYRQVLFERLLGSKTDA